MATRGGRTGSPLGCLVAGLLALAATAPVAAETPVKIGVLADRSGIFSEISGEGSLVAANMAVEDFGAARRGLRVEVITADHRNRPETGEEIARTWFDRDGVDLIIDVVNSGVALAVNRVAKEKNKAFIDTGAGTADLTGAQCTPNTVHWVFDTVALANGTGGALVRRGGDSWFFITADYAFGRTVERDTRAVVLRNGGTVLGSASMPFPAVDFSTSLSQARRSGAKVIGLANAGGDTINALTQAEELGMTGGKQAFAGLLVFSSDVHALGPGIAQGLVLTEAFYWDLNEATRAFSERFERRLPGRKPTANHAGIYSGILHYLKAVEAERSPADGARTVARMKALPTDDPLFGKGTIRVDGRKIHDMYLFEVKTPAESKGPWDLYKLLSTIPGKEAFRPLDEGGCPLVKKS